jgi:uncharacterized protein (TIGR03083 family)
VGGSDSTLKNEAVWTSLGRVADEVCSLVESAPDGGLAVPDSDWNVGEVAAHLAAGTEAYIRYVTGDDEPFVDVSDIAGGSLTHSNAARLQAEPERDLVALADRVRTASSALLEASSRRHHGDMVRWNGQPLALGDMLGVGLAEYLLHGRDIATALSRSWVIRPDDARLILASALPLLPLLVDPVTTAGVHARYDLRVRGGVSVTLIVGDGQLTVADADGQPVDCHVSADPGALLLVAYGRRSQWPAIFTGKLLAWGRKPWLGPRLVRYLVTP